MCTVASAVASALWHRLRPSLAPYVTGREPLKGTTARPEDANVGYPRTPACRGIALDGHNHRIHSLTRLSRSREHTILPPVTAGVNAGVRYSCAASATRVLRESGSPQPREGIGIVRPGAAFLFGLYLSVCCLVTASHGQVFFQSSQSHRQIIQLMNETEVVVESSMPEAKVVVQRGISLEIVLDIAGRFSIAGYHGPREKAGIHDLSGPDLGFGVSRSNGTLTLSSPEWTYIHHTFLINHLTITLPESIAIRLRQLSSDQLEGRR